MANSTKSCAKIYQRPAVDDLCRLFVFAVIRSLVPALKNEPPGRDLSCSANEVCNSFTVVSGRQDANRTDALVTSLALYMQRITPEATAVPAAERTSSWQSLVAVALILHTITRSSLQCSTSFVPSFGHGSLFRPTELVGRPALPGGCRRSRRR